MTTMRVFHKYAEKMERLLRLKTFPLAVKLLEKEEDIPEGAKRPLRDWGYHSVRTWSLHIVSISVDLLGPYVCCPIYRYVDLLCDGLPVHPSVGGERGGPSVGNRLLDGCEGRQQRRRPGYQGCVGAILNPNPDAAVASKDL